MKWLLFIVLFFSPLVASAVGFDFIVAADGSGTFRTVQEAINAVPDYRKIPTAIFIKKGTYKEKIVIAESKKKIYLIGESKDSTILTYDDFAQKKNIFGEEKGTSGSSSVFIYGEDFRAENITFQNSSGPVGQAVAVLVKADRSVFINCRFLGFQDTLYAYGDQNKTSRQYYRDCYIEGSVDFIFGWATAWFENCTLNCKTKSGYLTAASTPQNVPYGYIFRKCKVTADSANAVFYLGRPWRTYASVAFLECDLGKNIHPAGWNNWGKPEAEQYSRYAEYYNTGLGADISKRVKWAHQLTNEEASKITIPAVLGGEDNWKPE